jgi:hypothetical protein
MAINGARGAEVRGLAMRTRSTVEITTVDGGSVGSVPTLRQHGTYLRALVLDWPAGLAQCLAAEDHPVDRPADLPGSGSGWAEPEPALIAADRLARASSDRRVQVGSDVACAANGSRRL